MFVVGIVLFSIGLGSTFWGIICTDFGASFWKIVGNKDTYSILVETGIISDGGIYIYIGLTIVAVGFIFFSYGNKLRRNTLLYRDVLLSHKKINSSMIFSFCLLGLGIILIVLGMLLNNDIVSFATSLMKRKNLLNWNKGLAVGCFQGGLAIVISAAILLVYGLQKRNDELRYSDYTLTDYYAKLSFKYIIGVLKGILLLGFGVFSLVCGLLIDSSVGKGAGIDELQPGDIFNWCGVVAIIACVTVFTSVFQNRREERMSYCDSLINANEDKIQKTISNSLI